MSGLPTFLAPEAYAITPKKPLLEPFELYARNWITAQWLCAGRRSATSESLLDTYVPAIGTLAPLKKAAAWVQGCWGASAPLLSQGAADALSRMTQAWRNIAPLAAQRIAYKTTPGHAGHAYGSGTPAREIDRELSLTRNSVIDTNHDGSAIALINDLQSSTKR